MPRHRHRAIFGVLLITRPSSLEQSIIHKAAIREAVQALLLLVLDPHFNHERPPIVHVHSPTDSELHGVAVSLLNVRPDVKHLGKAQLFWRQIGRKYAH